MKESEKRIDNKGFTLVELIVIIAIMAILTSLVTLAIVRYIEKARQAIDVHNASMIRDAINMYPFPSAYQGNDIYYTDPETNETEHFLRGWVYVDKDEIRCSDATTALAMINAGLVSVSRETEINITANEENPTRWFPSGPDGDFIRRSNIDEYVFKNELTVKARNTWNTYQVDAYVAGANGDLTLGASASNAVRTDGHAKDAATAALFAKKLGFNSARITPIGEQYNGD